MTVVFRPASKAHAIADKDGVAIILCDASQKVYYERLASGMTILESCLHHALSEHLNSEICLETITNVETAKRWLQSTFFFERIQRNPGHYGIGKGDNQTWESRFDGLVAQALESLEKSQLIVVEGDSLASTEHGLQMSRSYVKQASMDLVLGLSVATSKRELVSINLVST